MEDKTDLNKKARLDIVSTQLINHLAVAEFQPLQDQ